MAALRDLATQQQLHVALVIHPRKHDEQEDLGLHTIFGTAKSTQEADNVWLIQSRESFKVFDIKKNRFDGDVGRAALGFNKANKTFFQLSKFELEGLLRRQRTIEDVIRDRADSMASPDVETITGLDEDINIHELVKKIENSKRKD